MTSAIRTPRWAGSFYPGDAESLRSLIQQLHRQARADRRAALPGGLRALILPHAGYIYSGLTAAHGTMLLEIGQYRRVFLIGPAHHVGVTGTAVSSARLYQTPLGEISLSELGKQLEKAHPDLFRENRVSEQAEHSLEVLLPFLQEALGSFSLVPLLVGQTDTTATAAALAPFIQDDDLVVVSSDLSHFLEYDSAVAKDRRTLDAILTMNMAALAHNDNMACGMVGIKILLHLARLKTWQPHLLHYSNSGDTAGDRNSVVGYGTLAFSALSAGEEQ